MSVSLAFSGSVYMDVAKWVFYFESRMPMPLSPESSLWVILAEEEKVEAQI